MEVEFYKNNPTPKDVHDAEDYESLEKIKLNDLGRGDLFVSSKGHRYRYMGDTNFIMDKMSELVDSECLEECTPRQLNLFWILMKNKK